MTISEQIGKKIKDLRKEKDLTQKQFGKLFGLSQNAITNIETGKRELYYDELIKIADYFEVSTDYLIKKNGIREQNPDLQYISDFTGLDHYALGMLNYCKSNTIYNATMDFINILIQKVLSTSGFELSDIVDDYMTINLNNNDFSILLNDALKNNDTSEETEETIIEKRFFISETENHMNGYRYSLNKVFELSLDEFLQSQCNENQIEIVQKEAEILQQYNKYRIMLLQGKKKTAIETGEYDEKKESKR